MDLFTYLLTLYLHARHPLYTVKLKNKLRKTVTTELKSTFTILALIRF